MTNPADESAPSPSADAPGKGAPSQTAARWRAPVKATVAVLAFLGLGGLFGQWLVHRISDVVSAQSPPAGFNELYGAWRQTARLNENLLTAGEEANRDLSKGASFTGRTPPRELQDELAGLREARAAASDLTGSVQSVDTPLSGARTSLLSLLWREVCQVSNAECPRRWRAFLSVGGRRAGLVRDARSDSYTRFGCRRTGFRRESRAV